jgi:hypothetical protein
MEGLLLLLILQEARVKNKKQNSAMFLRAEWIVFFIYLSVVNESFMAVNFPLFSLMAK